MKRFLLYASALLSIISCAKDKPEIQEIGIPYSIYDETEISSDDFYTTSMGIMSFIDSVPNTEELLLAYQMAVKDSYHSFKLVKITYITQDEKDKDIEVSALIVYPIVNKLDKVMLINHGTHLGLLEVPTYYTSPYGILAATGTLCILPDNIGLGVSSNHKDLYLNEKVQGRTSTDALLALYSFAKDRNLLAEGFNTYIWGYSQGGASTLATLKNFQSRPSFQQEAFNLTNVIAGDGPYDLLCTQACYQEDEAEGKPLAMGTVLATLVNGMFNSYPKEYKKFKYEDFFTAKALATGVPQAIRNNQETAFDMLFGFKDFMFSEVLNMDYLKPGSEVSNVFNSTLERQNLCKDWEPEYPLLLFHCNPDGVVPFQNGQNAYDGLKNDYVKFETPSTEILSFNPLLQHICGSIIMMTNTMQGKYF